MTPPTGRGDAARKGIHVFLSLVAGAVVYSLEPTAAAVVLAGASFVALAVELARRVSAGAARAFARLAPMLKAPEQRRLTGATLLSVGFTVTAVLFPGGPALAGILFAGLGDPAAALVGRRWGRLRYPGGKSPAGSTAFLVVVLLLSLALGVPFGAALATAALLTVVEALTLGVDDNLYLPVLGAAAVVAAGWLTGV